MYSKKYYIEKIEEFGGHNPVYDDMEGVVCYPAYLKVGERGWVLCERHDWLVGTHRFHTSVIRDIEYVEDRIIISTLHTKLTLKVKEEDSRSAMKPDRLLRNAIKCNHCGDIIESTHVHDFKTCSCGTVSVDGGREYCKRSFKNSPNDFEDLSEWEKRNEANPNFHEHYCF